MSFKNFLAPQAAPSNAKTPAGGEPAAQPSKRIPKLREAETDRRAVDRAEDEGMIVQTR